MSAKGRGTKVAKNEYYPTSHWAVWRLLDKIGHLLDGYVGVDWAAYQWLEPAVGGGAIVTAVEQWYGNQGMERDLASWLTCDIDPDMRMPGKAFIEGDYLRTSVPHIDVGITNPPFTLALEFARKMIADCGIAAVYQRLNWLSSADRRDFFEETQPSVYVLPNRPSHRADGKTDAAEYAWYVWGLYPESRLFWLANTERELRR